MNYKIINFICIVFFHFCTTLNASQDENTPLKVNFFIKQNDEIIDICGILPNPSHINYILSLFNSNNITEKNQTSTIPYDTTTYRYPYDLSYSNTTVTLPVSTATIVSKSVCAIDWIPKNKTAFGYGDLLIAVGEPNAGGGAGYIFALSETGTSFFPGPGGLQYTVTWGGASTAYTLTTVSVHPDGKHIAFGGNRTPENVTHRVILLDPVLSSTFIVADGDHGNTVRSVDWSPDGKYLAVAGEPSGGIGLRIYKFEYGALTELTRCRYKWHNSNTINSIRWHPSGKFIAVGGEYSTTKLGSETLYHQLKVLGFENEALSEIPGARVFQDGAMLVYGPSAFPIIYSVDWRADGNQLAYAYSSPNAFGSNIILYNFVNGERLSNKYGQGVFASTTRHKAVAASPDGAYWAAENEGYAGGGFPGSRLRVFPAFDRYDSSFSYPDGLASYVISSGSFINTVKWSPNGSTIACGCVNGAIYITILTENTAYLIKRIQGEIFNMYYSSLKIHNTIKDVIKPLAIANSNTLLTKQQNQVISYTKTHTFQTSTVTTNTVTDIAVSKDNQFVVVSQNKTPYVSIFVNKDGVLVPRTSPPALYPVNSVDISPNNRYILFGGVSTPARTYAYGFNDYSLKELTFSSTGAMYLQWYFDSSSFVLNGALYSFQDTAGISSLGSSYSKALKLDAGNKYRAYVTGTNLLNVDALQYSPFSLGSYSIDGEMVATATVSMATVDFVAWNNYSTIFVATKASTNAFAAYNFDGASLTLIGTGATPYPINSIDVDSNGQYAIIATNATSGNNIFEYRIDSTPVILKSSINHTAASGTSIPKVVKYSADNRHIFVGNQSFSGTPETLVTYKREFLTSDYALLQTCSSIINGLGDLNRETSNAIVKYSTLNKNNSNVVVAKAPLVIANSNAVAGLLVDTSQAIYNFVIPNSYAVVATANLAIANSYASIGLSSGVAEDNSNAIVSLSPLITANSNAINGLLRATSNAIAGLLVATSRAFGGLLVKTSQAINALPTRLAPLDTIDTGESNIHFNSASITMTYNLNLSTDHQLFVHTSGIVNGNGHSITLARGAGTQLTVDAGVTTTFQNVIFKDYNDQAVSLGSNASLIFGNQSRVELSEPQTLLRTWSFAGSSQLNGLGSSLTLGTGPLFLSALRSASLNLTNLNLLNVRENNIRSANNNSAINFQNASLNMAADYTYSVGSISVQNDLILRGTSTFNYTTIMGLTVNPASQLTIDQGMQFNYAPAGNFRNLLSLTDSSARLFFNNATLIATATGPRLTKGTLLVDGIMNIQSAAASSAQAIVFGNETPSNDLIVNIFPGAGINLTSGFLNYANAN